MPEDSLRPDDEVLSEVALDEGFSLCEVLAKPKKTYSDILGQELYVYWTDIESIDVDSLHQFHEYLVESKLLKRPRQAIALGKMDDQVHVESHRRHRRRVHEQFKTVGKALTYRIIGRSPARSGDAKQGSRNRFHRRLRYTLNDAVWCRQGLQP